MDEPAVSSAWERSLTPRGCDDCPFQYDTITCQHPAAPEGLPSYSLEERDKGAHPSWCPLLKGPVTVTLKRSAP